VGGYKNIPLEMEDGIRACSADSVDLKKVLASQILMILIRLILDLQSLKPP
jgi:hypothetical protein